MSIKADYVFNELLEFFEASKTKIKTEKDIENLIDIFGEEYYGRAKERGLDFPGTSEDYLLLAEEAETEKEILDYINKALALDPDNPDAILMFIQHKYNDDLNLKLKELESLERKERARISDYFDHNKGSFWDEIETRPYMRISYEIFQTLISMGMMKEAVKAGEAMIVLNNNDNMCVRFTLMHLYALLEDEEKAVELYKKYSIKNHNLELLLPLSVMYYKLRAYDKAREYLEKTTEENRYMKKFLRLVLNEDYAALAKEKGPSLFCTPGSLDELVGLFYAHLFLYQPTFKSYFPWAYNVLQKK